MINNTSNIQSSGINSLKVVIFSINNLYVIKIKLTNVKIKTIAITAVSKKFEIKDVISPCGACRQAIAEYEVKQENDIRILLHNPDESILIVNSVSDLLPFMFKSKGLKNY